jgi:hypothetical protein
MKTRTIILFILISFVITIIVSFQCSNETNIFIIVKMMTLSFFSGIMLFLMSHHPEFKQELGKLLYRVFMFVISFIFLIYAWMSNVELIQLVEHNRDEDYVMTVVIIIYHWILTVIYIVSLFKIISIAIIIDKQNMISPNNEHVLINNEHVLTNNEHVLTNNEHVLTNNEHVLTNVTFIGIKTVQKPNIIASNICDICYDNNNDTVLQCEHTFCSSCISKWQKSCPFCRREIV